jgi:hypothetical protein
MRMGRSAYAGAIAIGCAVALSTSLWWAALATFALVEAASAILRPAVRTPAPVVVLETRRATRAEHLDRAA